MTSRRNRWPFPGDVPLVRARKVALAYRDALSTVDPAACRRLDDRMRSYGQTWAVPRIVAFDLDAWVSVQDAAELASVEPAALRTWRRRRRIVGRLVNGRWEYRAGDVLALSTAPRTRRTKGDPR